MPLIVGEDIGRYVLSCSRQIKMNVPGINYKCIEAYSQERLLIRKTGRLKATVTKRQAATNQVVFHYVPKNHQHRFLLYYTLGILSSRIMFAYHLRKSGENEFTSVCHAQVSKGASYSYSIARKSNMASGGGNSGKGQGPFTKRWEVQSPRS
ncbi:TaqI-like C-terminal specificity domain-containing protein [Paracoccus aerius]|uniref:TaqI-like C-terminal specificity domain-containing protein n=1 Tax=Paracoccus aerius TaxID=1915382 RepID=UPI00361199D2